MAEEKKLADYKNEDLKTQLAAQEEVAEKRLQNKLNREKSAEMKELLANEEMVQATLEDLNSKLLKEKDNYDQMLQSKIELEEKLARLQKTKAEDTEVVEEQDTLLAALKAEIEAE